MYVHESHYRVEPSKKLPLMIDVHGSLRRAEHCRNSLIDLADCIGVAILSPLFSAGIIGPNDSHNYKFLRYRDIRYDLILLSMMDEVMQRWPGIETEKFYLIGYSGGKQFVCRFLCLHPRRLRGVSIGAPGTVTSLNREMESPRGLKDMEKHFDGLSVDVSGLRSVTHVQLVVGADNILPSRGDLLRWRAEQKLTGGSNFLPAERSLPIRAEALARLRDELVAEGVRVQYDVVPEAGHELQKVPPTVMKFLEDSLHGSQ